MGEVQINGTGSAEDSGILHVSGNCKMEQNNVKINGTGKIKGGEFGDVRVNGTAKCTGDLTAKDIRVNGTFACDGSITANSISCGGTMRCDSGISVGKLDINGTFRVKQGADIEAETISCNGTLHTEGQISADFLKARGQVTAHEIVGDHIVIRTKTFLLLRAFSWEKSKIDLIEATTIELSGVVAKSVNGSNITIGPNCQIDTLDCNGELSIHPSSEVSHITGEYSRRD